MAIRDLGRNRRRSFFSSLALGVGLALLLMMAAVVEGEMRGAMDSTIKLQSGHLQVNAATYDENKASLAWEDLVESPAQLAAQISALPPVKAATPRLYASGIVTQGSRSLGVRIVGVDPASPANEPYRAGMVSGEFIQADDREGILIGQALADKLKVQTGDLLTLLVNTSNGDVDEQRFTIRGIYSTGTSTYDEVNVFMPLAKAQAITQAGDHASTIFILLQGKEQTPAVVAALQTGKYQVRTLEQMNALLAQFDEMAGSYMIFMYLIVLGITVTVIVNTLIMSVFERTREIGILSAIGMRGGQIMAMFFAESGLLAIGGIVIGLVLGGLLAYYTYHVGIYIGKMGVTGILIGERIYGYLTLNDAITLSIMALVITLLAGLYPAVLAARMEPVDALRGGQ
ncbi:MAG: ABC transporter permease [Anaerolineales bacterium]|nr:ABC transporter permease [Anaerolineales bacterium]